MSKPAYKRKLSNYLLNGDIQFSYIFSVLVAVTLICGALGFLIYQQEASAVSNLNEFLGKSVLAPDDATFVMDSVASSKLRLLVQMAIVGVLVLVVVFLYLTVMTHKVAGPIHKVSGYLEKMKKGELGDVWPLRKGDMLVSFYERFRQTHQVVRERHQANELAISAFLEVAAHDKAQDPQSKEVLEKAEAHCEGRRKALS